MSELLEQYYGRKLILIDTAGLSPNDTRGRGQVSLLKAAKVPLKLCLVLSATSQVVTLKQVIATHRSLNPNLCVLTKLDEANTLGGALSVVMDEELKIAYQCAGQRVPEDLQKADATDIIARSISMMKKFCSEGDDAQIEQSFGKYSVYHPFGEKYEH